MKTFVLTSFLKQILALENVSMSMLIWLCDCSFVVSLLYESWVMNVVFLCSQVLTQSWPIWLVFPHVFGSNLCPLSPIVRACLLVYFSWCGHTSLHCCQLWQLSVKEKTWLGSCGEETLLWNPAHPLVLRCLIKVSSLVSMRWCPLRPLSAICDSLYCSKPHGFNESLKAATPSAP